MTGKRLSWRKCIPELELLNERIYAGEVSSKPLLFDHLKNIFGEGTTLRQTDTRVLAFIEFSFYQAEGPYSDRRTRW